MSARKIRVVIVDDSPFVRQALARIFGDAPDIEVVGTAADGVAGIAEVKRLQPDVVTLDVKMPRLGGLEALQRIMLESPTPVLLLSSVTGEGTEATLRGLELGAVDFVDKSSVRGSMNLLGLAEELRSKVRALAGVPAPRLTALGRGAAFEPVRAGRRRRVKLVAIAASTGGPAALQVVLPALPKSLTAAVVVVQHMPPGFTRSLAQRLDPRCPLPVREASDGDWLEPGSVLIAPAGRHTLLRREGNRARITLEDEPRAALYRPSADLFMTSAAEVLADGVLGVVLTGMGADGAVGLGAIRARGGRTIVESEETCMIYGMPKAALDAGCADRVLPLPAVAAAILDEIGATLVGEN